MAYFITYDADRPKGMPPICLFSDLNHPPRRDYIKHLPYSEEDSRRLGGRVQAYSFWTSPDPTKPPIQVGASPDRTADGAALFGYAFKSAWEPDESDAAAEAYRHPHSFYFSGFPGDPPNAPIVSQYFTKFAMIKPDPAQTWDVVAKLIGSNQPVPACSLFGPTSGDPLGAAGSPWPGPERMEGSTARARAWRMRRHDRAGTGGHSGGPAGPGSAGITAVNRRRSCSSGRVLAFAGGGPAWATVRPTAMYRPEVGRTGAGLMPGSSTSRPPCSISSPAGHRPCSLDCFGASSVGRRWHW